MFTVEIHNLPEDIKRYTVARYVDDEWWFWGTWDEKWRALEASRDIKGAVFENVLDHQFTIKPEVRHGKWQCIAEYEEFNEEMADYRCESCGYVISRLKNQTPNFCERCGADMREESDYNAEITGCCLFEPKQPKKQEPMTNADRIRAMTDEELAKFLDITCGCSVCFLDATAGECTSFKSSVDCIINKMKWLKQDVSKNVETDLLGTERGTKMTYNTISLIDKEGQKQIFGIMKITLKEHLEQAIQRGCELCKEHGADGFQINYIRGEFPWEKSIYYDVHGNEISAEVVNSNF